MSDTLRARLVVLLGAVGNNRSTVEQREELLDGLVLLSRTAVLPRTGRTSCAAPNEASHGGGVVPPPEEPVEINMASLKELTLRLRPKDDGTAVWRHAGGEVGLSMNGGQLVGRVVLGVDGPVVRFTAPVRFTGSP